MPRKSPTSAAVDIYISNADDKGDFLGISLKSYWGYSWVNGILSGIK